MNKHKFGGSSSRKPAKKLEYQVWCVSKDYIVYQGTWTECRELLIDLMAKDVQVKMVKVMV